MILQVTIPQFTLYMRQIAAILIPQRAKLLANRLFQLLLLPAGRRRFQHMPHLIISIPLQSLQHLVFIHHPRVLLEYLYLPLQLLVLRQFNHSEERIVVLLYMYQDNHPSDAPP